MWNSSELRRNWKRFNFLAAQPGNTKRIPVSTRFVLKSLAAVPLNTNWGTINGVVQQTPLMPINGTKVYNSMPADSLVVVNAGFELYIDSGLGKLKKLITGA